LNNAIIHKPPKCFQPNLKLTIYMDILGCRKSLKQIMMIQFFRIDFQKFSTDYSSIKSCDHIIMQLQGCS